MTQEDKKLLLKDLCSRLPYGVKVQVGEDMCMTLRQIDSNCFCECWGNEDFKCHSRWMLPFLRPMSSMTEEEIKEFTELIFISDPNSYGYLKECELFSVYCDKAIDWLNKKMFDYRGLIPMGLAIEVTEENNPYKE